MTSLRLLVLPALFTFTSPLCAGEPNLQKSVLESTSPPAIEWRVRAASSYTFEGDFKDESLGKQDAMEVRGSVAAAIPIAEKWKLVLGGRYERFDFGSSSAPVPDTLQGLAGVVGMEYWIGDQPALFLRSAPGVYSAGDLGDGGFDIPTILAGGYPLTPNFIVIGGVSASLMREYPILPVVGFIWTINDAITLDATLPTPKLTFELSESCSFSFVGNLIGGSFDTADDDPNYPSTTVDYYDIRSGLELECQPIDNWTFAVQAGWSFQRKFEYDEPSRTVTTKGAPYVGISVAAQF